MPRISYTYPSDAVAQQMSERRGGKLTPLDLLLAHNDGLALGWNSLLGAVRSQFQIPGDIREMIVLRIGYLNLADYEWDAHLPVARREGLGEDVIDCLREKTPITGEDAYDAVLRYVDEMTKNVAVPSAVFSGLRRFFSESEIAEITATAATYNMVSRFLVALDVKTGDRDSLPDKPEN